MVAGQRYEILSPSLIETLETLDRDVAAQWLFLDPSSEFKGRWEVDCLWPEWFFEFEDIVGHFRSLSPLKLDKFLTRAQELDYRVIFNEEPEAILEPYERLNDIPPFEIISDLENTTNGMFFWQVAGFNKLIKDESLNGGLVVWSTGTGKTVFIASAIKWHELYGHPYDLALVVVKSNNKADMNRKLLKLAGLESIIIQGRPEKRLAIYEDIKLKLDAGKKVIAITNYEKLREDPGFFKAIIKKRNLLVFWDEIPTRLSNQTKLYGKVRGLLWNPFKARDLGLDGAKPRANWMRQWGLTATPIENDPEGCFNYIRLMNPPLLGRTEDFQTQYVASRNFFSDKPERWQNLDRLEATLEFMVHRASREEDPEIAKMFPDVIEDTIVIDWHEKDRIIYDILTGKAREIIEEDFDEANILALIQILQMLCDAPSMIPESAHKREVWEEIIRNWDPADGPAPPPKGSEIAQQLLASLKSVPSDDHHTKLDMLGDILLNKHPDDKSLIFMTWNAYGMKPLTRKLDQWGVTYVTYEGTQAHANKAKDRFREDPTIQVFLSSDRGADSIDLPEAAVGINYNLPWTWVRKRQRMRNVRVDSELATNYWYDLVMADSVEERKQEIIQTKYGYHAALFDGKAVEESMSAKLTREDLLHILLGANS